MFDSVNNSDNKELTIDKGFRNLIRPLFKQEYLQLEANILAYGCNTPITTWNGVIIDGHNRYEICRKHGIPFEVEEMTFEYREEAIAWICANQLGRRNLTEESRKFLIGMQYEAEKTVNEKKNPSGFNQYSHPDAGLPYEEFDPNGNVFVTNSRSKTANKIAKENHISHGTVEKYALYSKALEKIEKKEPALLPKILSGRYKISHQGVLELADMDEAEIKKINRRLEQSAHPFAKYQTTRNEIKRSTESPDTKPATPPASVKDMPEYDPDAEITGLTLTIPSWISSLDRVAKGTDFSAVSGSARSKLQNVLAQLQESIREISSFIREV